MALPLIVAALAPLLAPFDPGAQALDSGLSGPSRSHWLGQDRLGRGLPERLPPRRALHARAGAGGAGEGEQDPGKGEEDVGKAHEEVVDPPAQESRRRSHEKADR